MPFHEGVYHRVARLGHTCGRQFGHYEILEVTLQPVLALPHKAHSKNQIPLHELDQIGSDLIALISQRIKWT